MSENAPAFEKESHHSDDYAEVTKTEAEFKKKKFQFEQNEKFGKYDTFTGPLNRGEASHDSYHAQRPTDGIYRNGNQLQVAGNVPGTGSGNFASTEAYLAQTDTSNTSNDKYYDAVNGISESTNAEYTPPNYEKMNTRELAVSMVDAEELGDTEEVVKIHETVVNLLMEAATHPESDMTDADYEDEIKRFDWYVEQVKKLRSSKNEAATFKENDGALPDVTSLDEGVAETAEESHSEAEPTKEEAAAVSAHTLGLKAEMNGETVSVGAAFDGLDGEVVHEVTNEAGAKSLHAASELVASAEKKEEASRLDKLKGLWGKSRDFIKEKFTMGYLETKWMIEDSIINRGVDPLTMSGQEIEDKKERNRTIAFIGAGALLIGAIILNESDAFGHFNAADTSASLDGAGSSPVDTSWAENNVPLSERDQAIADSLTPDQSSVGVNAETFQDQQLPTTEAVPSYEPISTPDGSGGISMFESIGLSEDDWYAHAEQLRNDWPQDFYDMPSGGIGIKHPGLLSQGAQDAINALRG